MLSERNVIRDLCFLNKGRSIILMFLYLGNQSGMVRFPGKSIITVLHGVIHSIVIIVDCLFLSYISVGSIELASRSNCMVIQVFLYGSGRIGKILFRTFVHNGNVTLVSAVLPPTVCLV